MRLYVSQSYSHPLKESRFLTELGDVGSVVVSEHLVAQYGIGDLRKQEYRSSITA